MVGFMVKFINWPAAKASGWFGYGEMYDFST